MRERGLAGASSGKVAGVPASCAAERMHSCDGHATEGARGARRARAETHGCREEEASLRLFRLEFRYFNYSSPKSLALLKRGD